MSEAKKSEERKIVEDLEDLEDSPEESEEWKMAEDL
jgi:hypothetical protein